MTCVVCHAPLTLRTGERRAKFARRRTCGGECHKIFNGRVRAEHNSVDVFGLRVTRVELAALVAVGLTGVHARLQQGRDPLTGRGAA